MLRRSLAAVVAGACLLSLAAPAALAGPAQPPHGATAATSTISAARVDATLKRDLRNAVGLVESWRAAHPRYDAPARRYVLDRVEHTGANRILYTRINHVGYCLIADNPKSTLGKNEAFWFDSTAGFRRGTADALRDGGACEAAAALIVRTKMIRRVQEDVSMVAMALDLWMMEHPKQTTTDLTRLAKGLGLDTLTLSGSSVTVAWVDPADATRGFCLTGTHDLLTLKAGQGIWYDSEAGGMQDSLNRPTAAGSACAATAPALSPAVAAFVTGQPPVGATYATSTLSDTDKARALRRDLRGAVRLIDAWANRHPRYQAPAGRYLRDRMTRTGRNGFGYRRVPNQGYCLAGVNVSGLDFETATEKQVLAIPVLVHASTAPGSETVSLGRVLAGRYKTGPCAALFGTQQPSRREALAATVKADLRQAALAAEVYATDHPAQTRPYTMRDLRESVGFRASRGSRIQIAGSPANGYCLKGTHRRLHLKQGHAYWFDSARGLLGGPSAQPTRGVCGRVTF